jgi:hypothetical protein
VWDLGGDWGEAIDRLPPPFILKNPLLIHFLFFILFYSFFWIKRGFFNIEGGREPVNGLPPITTHGILGVFSISLFFYCFVILSPSMLGCCVCFWRKREINFLFFIYSIFFLLLFPCNQIGRTERLGRIFILNFFFSSKFHILCGDDQGKMERVDDGVEVTRGGEGAGAQRTIFY